MPRVEISYGRCLGSDLPDSKLSVLPDIPVVSSSSKESRVMCLSRDTPIRRLMLGNVPSMTLWRDNPQSVDQVGICCNTLSRLGKLNCM